MKLAIAGAMILAILGLWQYNRHMSAKSEQATLAAKNHKPFQPVGSQPLRRTTTAFQPPAFQEPQRIPAAQQPGRFNCDGRTHCSHMRSCEEAVYFIQNCPNTAMDGDNDGIPCEKQWC